MLERIVPSSNQPGEGGVVQAWFGNGDGTFTPGQSTAVGAPFYGVAVADFNLDGIPDIEIANEPYTIDGSPLVTLLGELTTQASLSGISFQGAGLHSVVASYSGDATHQSSTSASVTPPNTTGSPGFTPPSGFTQMVSINSVTPDASVFYTLDGTTPTPASIKYTGPV